MLRIAPECAEAADRKGRTPLHLAVRANALAVYERFVEALVCARPACARAKDESGRTAFQCATPEYKALMRKLLGAAAEG